MSDTVRSSFESWSGRIHTRMAYSLTLPPRTSALPTPRIRANSSTTLMEA